jgi:uncharacterized repeat protein (TIGR02543 family)
MVNGTYNFKLPGCSQISAPSSSSLNTWHHVGLSYDGTTLRGFLNGIEVASTACTRVVSANAYYYGIGGNDGTDMNPSAQAKGGFRISSLQIYKSAVSALKVTDLFNYSTVTYASNYSGGPTSTTQRISNGVNTNLQANAFTRSTIPFTQWSVTSTQNSAYADASQVNLRGNLTLYAQWGYLVTYKPGNFASNPELTGYKTHGTNLALRNSGNANLNFTRTGHTVVGWSTSADGSTTDYALGASYATDAALTLYPVWESNQKSVTYRAGTNGSGANQVVNKTSGVALAIANSASANSWFTRTGHTVTGWSTTDGGAQTHALNASYTTESNLTLYPVWTANTQTITYSAGTGGTGSAPTSPATVSFGFTFTTPVNTYTRDGFTFAGWSDSTNIFSANVTYPTTGSVSANVTLTATWTANKYSYNANTGSNAPADQTFSGTTLTAASGSSVTAPTGYSFAGWCTTQPAVGAVCGGTSYAAGANLPTPSFATVNLFAVWTVRYPYLSFNASDTSSYAGSGTSVTDTSYNGFTGTMPPGAYNSTTRTFNFAGLTSGSFANPSSRNPNLADGLSVQFVADINAATADWSMLFDFGTNANNNYVRAQFWNTSESTRRLSLFIANGSGNYSCNTDPGAISSGLKMYSIQVGPSTCSIKVNGTAAATTVTGTYGTAVPSTTGTWVYRIAGSILDTARVRANIRAFSFSP